MMLLSTTKLKLTIGSLFVWHTFMCLVWFVTYGFWFTSYYYANRLKINTDWARNEFVESCPLSTNNIDDLIVGAKTSDDDKQYNIDQLDKHGVSIIPNVLSEDTVTKLREFVNIANKEMHQVFVLEEENRYRIMPTPFEIPIIAKAMEEIALHDKLRPLIDGSALGPYASLVAFSFITSKYGAIAQEWHQDTVISAITHPTEFVHEYTLTIPLQDTTKGMGATQFCPGTHKCHWLEYNREAIIKEVDYKPLPTKGASQEDIDEYIEEFEEQYLPCKDINANLNKGDALMYHTDLIHRGGEFYDKSSKDTDRIVLFVTFAESKRVDDMNWLTFFDYKSLPLGKVHSLDWKMWGLTIDDFPNLIHLHKEYTTMTKYYYHNFKSWFVGPMFGYGSHTGWSSSGSVDKRLLIRPWTAIDAFMMIFNEPDGVCYYIHNEFDANEAKKLACKFVYIALVLTFIYCWIGIPLWVHTIITIFKQQGIEQQQQQRENGSSHHQNGTSNNSNGLHHAKVE